MKPFNSISGDWFNVIYWSSFMLGIFKIKYVLGLVIFGSHELFSDNIN